MSHDEEEQKERWTIKSPHKSCTTKKRLGHTFFYYIVDFCIYCYFVVVTRFECSLISKSLFSTSFNCFHEIPFSIIQQNLINCLLRKAFKWSFLCSIKIKVIKSRILDFGSVWFVEQQWLCDAWLKNNHILLNEKLIKRLFYPKYNSLERCAVTFSIFLSLCQMNVIFTKFYFTQSTSITVRLV